MSVTLTPRLDPLMTIVVPPWGGPRLGMTEIISGNGQFPDWVTKPLPEHVSFTRHWEEEEHHPHSKPVPTFWARHKEQSGSIASSEHWYRITERKEQTRQRATSKTNIQRESNCTVNTFHTDFPNSLANLKNVQRWLAYLILYLQKLINKRHYKHIIITTK